MDAITKSSNGSNCSCSSCIYKSESDRQSVRDFLAHGSRIDRLYYGKYIPLREKKLTKRLVRTKAVYDDLRAQILSDSTLSVKRKRKTGHRNKLPAKRSSTLLQLIEMNDPSGALSSKNLSECCSCCSCASKIDTHDELPKRYKRRLTYKSMYRTGRHKAERGVYGGKKGVRFKTKHIRSDPCTCTFKLSGLLKKYSKMKFKKPHKSSPLPVPFDLESMAEENIRPKRSFSATLSQNWKNQKELVADAFLEGMQKLKDSKTKIQENLEFSAKRSLEKIKQATDKIMSSKKFNKQKDNVKTKPDINIESRCECPVSDLISQIKKDSLIKFRDDLKRKYISKQSECKPECYERTCDPKECFIKLRQKASPKIKPKLRKQIDFKNEMNKQTEMIGKPMKARNQQGKVAYSDDSLKIKPLIHIKSRQGKKIESEYKKQGQANKTLMRPIRNNRNVHNTQPIREKKSKQAVRIGSSFSFNIEFYKNINAPTEDIHKPISKGSYLSNQSLPRKYTNYKRKKTKRSKYRFHNRSSQSEVNIKKPKTKKKTKTNLKRCFCTLAFRGNKNNTFANKIAKDKIKHTQTDSFYNSQVRDRLPEAKYTKQINKKVIKPYENQFVPIICDPGICIPDQCDPFNCIKVMNMRRAKVKKRSVKCLCSGSSLRSRGTKSTSSFTSRGNSTTNNVQSMITYTKRPKNVMKPVERIENVKKRPKMPIYQKQTIDNNRQAVRIGSTFSFNIEFYKNKTPPPVQASTYQHLLTKPKAQKQQKLQYKKLRKNQRTSSDYHVKKAHKKQGLNIHLKRCFCTLKLQEHNYLKRNKKQKMRSTASETVENSYFDILMLNRSTKMDNRKTNLLEPFECEPFVCVPGECDPFLCLERIKKRNKQLKNASVITQPQLRAEGSDTDHFKISSKFIQVQPKLRPKHEKTFTKRKSESFKRLKFDEKFSDGWRDKQSVNIGSSFSFNIEFKKNRVPTTRPTLQYFPKRKTLKNKDTNSQILNVATEDTQIEIPRKYQKSSMIRPLMKRCFCTLNLQKKHKQHLLNRLFSNSMRHDVYTVNRILTEKSNLHYKYNKNNTKSVSNLNPYVSNHSICISEENYNKGTTRSLRMFQSTLHMFEAVEVNSKQINICLNKSSSICRNQATDTRQSFVTDSTSVCHNIFTCDNNKYAEEMTMFPLTSNQIQENRISYYKKCFCTMNLHIENKYNHKNLRNMKFKRRSHLENHENTYPKNAIHPYECEPGVCIPGQCDPNECIKLIMKRGGRHKSVQNNAGKIITQTFSSNTYPFVNKSTKARKEFLLKNNLSENRKEAFGSKNNNVVRIGSSFSFDIEFFKKSRTLTDDNDNNQITLMTPITPYKKAEINKNKSSKSFKTLGTRMKEQNYHSMQSQSKLLRETHKASATLPILKRCFCTLKLQKKGRMYKNLSTEQAKPPFYQDQNVIKIKTATKSQNTRKNKILKAPNRLLPYECEPNICDPDNCDPYQCLEIMKRNMKYRHDKKLGVDPLLYKNKSVLSITTKNKSKASQSIRQYRSIPKSQQKLRLGDVEPNSVIRPKQAVRIGSSFSFNIEFTKGLPQPSLDHKNLKNNNYVKHISHSNNLKQESSVKPILREKSSKVLKLKSPMHKKSQAENIVKNTSSMASTFVKRCFCTAKLHRTNTKNTGLHLRKHPKPSFFKKCLCWFKESQTNRFKLKNQGINSVIKRCFCTMQFYNKKARTVLNGRARTKTQTKSMMTENRTLLPYECEPGICIPYQCDPYKCDKIMQTRRKEKHMYGIAKQSTPILLPYECEPLTCIPGECNPIECLKRIKKREFNTKNFGTAAANDMYTASTMTKTNARSKNKNNQFHNKNYLISPNATAKRVLASNYNKQAVRIGSKFSFDIQFYKNTSDTDLKSYHKNIVQAKDKPKIVTKKTSPPRVQNKHIMSEVQTKHTPQLQTEHVKGEAKYSDLKSFYKKCFCILKLNKFKTKPIPLTKTLNTTDSSTGTQYKISRLSSQPKLLPYECEPGVCVPGMCDPLECEKRIQSRHLKEFNQQTKNTLRSKQKGTKTMKRKSVKLQIPKSLELKNEPNIKNFQNQNLDRKVCRIGSEFSFNIEFSKNRYGKPDTHVRKLIDNEIGSDKINRTTAKKLKRELALQSNAQNKNLNKLSMNSPLTRCFCTLKLQNLPGNSFKYQRHKNKWIEKKPSQRSVMSNVTPANLNILNSPDLYDKRKSKSRDATSQIVRQSSNKGIGMKAPRYKKNVQTKFVDQVNDFSKQGYLKRKQRLVEVPKLKKPLNKQAVRIGSNISFEIEFSKRAPPKTEFMDIMDKHESSRQKKSPYNKRLYSDSRSSQVKPITSKGKRLQVNNALKRCFCTLKLQDVKSKPVKKDITKLSGVQIYPQVLEVRRVSIQKKPKQVAQQTVPPIRTVATQSKYKCKKKKNVSEQCKCYLSQTSEHNNSNEMRTILPYTPKKFNKSNSKTLLTRHYKNDYPKLIEKDPPNKRLTKKKSQGVINIVKHSKHPSKKSSGFNIKKFFCQCAHLLSPKKDDTHKIENATQDINFNNNNTQPVNKNKEILTAQDILELCENKQCPVKKSKKYKFNTNDAIGNTRSSKFRNRKDVNEINAKSTKSAKSTKDVKHNKKDLDLHCTCKCFPEEAKDNMKMNTLCSFCQNKIQDEINRNNLSSPRLNVRFLDPLVTSQIDFLDRKKRFKKRIKVSGPKLQEQKRCRSCGRIIDAEEIRKGAGDYTEIIRKSHKRSKSPSEKLKRMFRSKICPKLCESKDIPKPALKMLLNSGNYDIINKDDIMGNFARASPNKTRRNKKKQPCICGSLICAEKNENISSRRRTKNISKQCKCDSPICYRESAAMKRILRDPGEITCLCQKFKDKKKAKEINVNYEHQLKEDAIHRRKRKKEDKEKEKQINKQSNDFVLCAESFIDIGKLGITACTDILRGVVKISSDPRQAIRNLKAMKDDPRLIARKLKICVNDIGVASTMRRVRLRCLAMNGVKKLKRTLESYGITNYILHIADKNPKKRIVKPRRPVRSRERLDFGGSLYMSSRRKRPFLFVYDRWPWLYPQFLSLINLYKQFRDILLFLLAVVVWSPCILCTEICRAMTCCLFCTG